MLFYFSQTIITRDFRGQSLIPITALLLSLRYWTDLLVSDAWYRYDALSYKACLVDAKVAADCYPVHNRLLLKFFFKNRTRNGVSGSCLEEQFKIKWLSG